MKKYFKSPDDPKLSDPKALIKVMKKVLGSTDESIQKFFYKAEFEYPNGEVAPFLFIGAPSGKWKEYLKTAKKDKDFAYGECQLNEEGKLLLNILKGKGKKAAFLKELNKKILKKSGGKIAEFVSELVGVSAAPEESAVGDNDAIEEAPSNIDPKVLVEQAKDIANHFKAVKKEFNIDTVDSVIEELDDWVEAFESLHQDLRTKLQKMADQLAGVRKDLDALQAKDDKVQGKLNKIVGYIEEWDAMENHASIEAKIQEELILRKLAKVKPLAEEIKDKEAIEAINELEAAFQA